MQARFTASAHAAKGGRAFPQLNTGSKNRALFLLGVLGVGVWSYRPCKTTARSLSCTGKGGTRKELSGHHLTHASGRLDVAVGMLRAVLLSLPEGSGLFVPLGYSHPGRVLCKRCFVHHVLRQLPVKMTFGLPSKVRCSHVSSASCSFANMVTVNETCWC